LHENGGMSLADDVGAGLDGLAQLRSLIASGRRPGILVTLDFNFIEVEKGRAVFAGTPGEHAYNPIGTVHSCLTAAQAYTTLELKVAYHKAVTRDTGMLRAEGQVISIGRRAAFAEATLEDAQGKLYASATSTLLVMER
jgi:acyl-coenzyme A thioesterase PaaI-like protein